MHNVFVDIVTFLLTTQLQEYVWQHAGLDRKSWIFDTGISTEHSQIDQSLDNSCPVGMQHVCGAMLQDDAVLGSVQELQSSTCMKWIGPFVNGRPIYPERCIEFNEQKWRSITPKLSTKYVDVCVDTYEYPNLAGQNPLISITYTESKKMCEAIGKRLCTEDEWTFACEGPEALPYPYGFKRDKNICNIDKHWHAFNEKKLSARGTEIQRDELARLWQGEPSGFREKCVSVFGVYDLTGNIDEWATASRPSKFISILKGGYYGPVRTRCRPSTRNHSPEHYFYQQGFRCCFSPLLKI